jgi:hypothetical protein
MTLVSMEPELDPCWQTLIEVSLLNLLTPRELLHNVLRPMANVEALHQIMVLGMVAGPSVPSAKRVRFLVRVVIYLLVVL